jgi:response regulator RpfG family c-di-GMP phosphodiesterase
MPKEKKEAIIVHFDEEEYYSAVVDLMLFSAGLKLTAAAHTRKDAEKLLKDIAEGKIKPEIAIIDTILQHNHGEGATVAQEIKRVSPNTKLIAYTILDEDEIPWADYIAIKSQLDPERTLLKGLESLLKVQIGTSSTPDLS